MTTAAKQGRKEPVGVVHAFRSEDGSGDILMLIWMDKHKIIMLSTKHKVGMMLVRTKQVHVVSFVELSGIIIVHTSTTERTLTYMCADTHAHACTCIYILTLADSHSHTYTPPPTHTHAHMHARTHTHTLKHAHTHTNTHTHTHTCTT